MGKKYDGLRKQYPQYISKIQLYQICGISPRSATYLLENGIIPAIDTGKQTWRYKIELDDVITYLRRREQWGSMIPHGAASSRYKRPRNKCKSFSSLVTSGQESEIAEYFTHIYADCPDVLTAKDVLEMTGFCNETIFRMLRNGELKSVMDGKRYLIPKPYLLQYLQTPAFIKSRSSSEKFKRILGGFEIWKAAKS